MYNLISRTTEVIFVCIYMYMYVIIHLREQGVRSVKVTGASSDVENTPAYSILPNEVSIKLHQVCNVNQC